ncbi:MAG: Hpt domain-containing protein [Planctomycetes bacterium]|nr:Hpt domain-containing protein [Planctomycetota bacterium]
MSNESAYGPLTSELVADDPSLADLVAEFVDGLHARAQAIQKAIDAQAFDTIESLSHQLKGAGGGYGYPALSQTAAQLEQCVLQSLRETLEALRKTHRARLPVRVRQHEMVNHVVEGLTRNGYPKRPHPREIRLAQRARCMHLLKHHLPLRPLQRPPHLHPPLQRPQLTIGKPPRTTPLQILEQGLRLETRVVLEFVADLLPDLLEGVQPRPPPMGLFHLAR